MQALASPSLSRSQTKITAPPLYSTHYLKLLSIYPENVVLISQLEVCQEGGVKNGSTWRTLGAPDWRHGGKGYS